MSIRVNLFRSDTTVREHERRARGAARSRRHYRANLKTCRAQSRARQAAKHAALTPEQKKAERARLRQWRKDHPQHDRDKHLRRKYGLAPGEYDEMLRAQGGVCAACKKPQTRGERLCVDHDHTSGDVRGLLCHHCNVAIGMVGDNVTRLEALIVYLRGGK